MIIYENTKGGFVQDVRSGRIASCVKDQFEQHGIFHHNDAEFRAWSNSLLYMRNVLDDDQIPDDVSLAIEYQIPLTSKRVDFLIAGKDEKASNNVVVVELKQWEDSGITSRPDVVTAFTGGANRSVCHPCYQAYSYAKIIENFNEDVYRRGVRLYPCAYLHNYKECNRTHIDNAHYRDAISVAPLFLQEDIEKLRIFIRSYIKKKDGIDLLMKIDHGKLKPAKALQDSLVSMIQGNQEFYLIDEQKVAYETVKKLVENAVRKASDPVKGGQKSVVIVSGGPGTGKSVVAIQLLCDLIAKGFSANYVTKNAAPRNVYFEKLRQENYKKNYIKSLFKSSDSFWNAPSSLLDCVIVDEAHRLKKKSMIFHGENQVKELINAGLVTVFFIDEDQKITTKDIGSKDEIRKWADFYGAKLYEGDDLNLVSQFRCNGSDGYLNFLDNLLEIRKTANVFFDYDYDVQVFDSPVKMREALREKNSLNNKSRMIAGYCYEWITEDNPEGDDYDIVLEDGFRAKWNFTNTLFAINPDSFDQVGCIHTTQGLEFDYCGIIIGQDLRYENGHVITDQTKEAESDNTSGIRTCKNTILADRRIRNTYKTLLSRGQKGCFIYCEDAALRDYIRTLIQPKNKEPQDNLVYLPVVGEIAAGHEHFMEEEIITQIGVEPYNLHPNTPGKYFFLKVSGDSMIGADILDGNAVLIRRMSNPRGDLKNGDIIACMIHGDRATLKTYFKESDGIRLHPENPDYEDIFVPMEDFMIGDARIIGKIVGVWEIDD